jgi:hypothetical protein
LARQNGESGFQISQMKGKGLCESLKENQFRKKIDDIKRILGGKEPAIVASKSMQRKEYSNRL